MVEPKEKWSRKDGHSLSSDEIRNNISKDLPEDMYFNGTKEFNDFIKDNCYKIVYFKKCRKMTNEYLVSLMTKDEKLNYRCYIFVNKEDEKLLLPTEKLIQKNRENVVMLISGSDTYTTNPYKKIDNFFSPSYTMKAFLLYSGMPRVNFEAKDIFAGIYDYEILTLNKNNELKKAYDKKKGFDTIKISIRVVKPFEIESREAFIKILELIKPEIDSIVLGRIERSPQFMKYGVPINILECVKCILTHDMILSYIFELKKELKSEEV